MSLLLLMGVVTKPLNAKASFLLSEASQKTSYKSALKSKFVKNVKKKKLAKRKKFMRKNTRKVSSSSSDPLIYSMERIKVQHVQSQRKIGFHFAGDRIVLHFWKDMDKDVEEHHRILSALYVQYNYEMDIHVISINLNGIDYVKKNMNLEKWKKKYPALYFTLFATTNSIYRDTGKKYPLILLDNRGNILYKGSFTGKEAIESVYKTKIKNQNK